jgi:glyoxylase I family protein
MMPKIAGFSHISLSVTDRDASVGFYRDVFGFQPFDHNDGEHWLETISVHPDTGAVCLQQHLTNDHEPFHPRRSGLDHLAFRVDSRQQLDTRQDRLAELGVRHSPIVDRDYGSVLCARDPDGIQLELFDRPNHP